ncbi:MAG: response regulator [Anaerolineae bacterium]|nr:response regulator [Anaerolineae bacterium]
MSTTPRILLVEDRPDWQSIIKRNLRGIPCTIDVADSYEDALKLLRMRAYALAVIDPVLDNSNKYNRDGLRVLSEIHRLSPETRLIVISGSLTNATLRKFEMMPPRLPMLEKPAGIGRTSGRWSAVCWTNPSRFRLPPPQKSPCLYAPLPQVAPSATPKPIFPSLQEKPSRAAGRVSSSSKTPRLADDPLSDDRGGRVVLAGGDRW